MPTMEYTASVPDQVTSAIQMLTNACGNWPQVPMPSDPTLALKVNDATIAATHICHVVMNTDSTGWAAFSFGVLAGGFLVFLVWLFCGALREIYQLARHIYFSIKLRTDATRLISKHIPK